MDMKRALLLSFSFFLWMGCEPSNETGILRTPAEPYGAAVRAPFDAMVENARQPDMILGRVYFEYDKANLSESAKRQLEEIVKQTARRSGLVVVEGHADHMNSDKYNIKLGYERALAVADFLRSEGVWDERLVVKSFGEERPETTNWKDLRRSLNRCVVVRMFAQGEGMPGDQAVKIYRKSAQPKQAGKGGSASSSNFSTSDSGGSGGSGDSNPKPESTDASK